MESGEGMEGCNFLSQPEAAVGPSRPRGGRHHTSPAGLLPTHPACYIAGGAIPWEFSQQNIDFKSDLVIRDLLLLLEDIN